MHDPLVRRCNITCQRISRKEVWRKVSFQKIEKGARNRVVSVGRYEFVCRKRTPQRGREVISRLSLRFRRSLGIAKPVRSYSKVRCPRGGTFLRTLCPRDSGIHKQPVLCRN